MLLAVAPYVDDIGELEVGMFQFPVTNERRFAGHDFNKTLHEAICHQILRMIRWIFFTYTAACFILVLLSTDDYFFVVARFVLTNLWAMLMACVCLVTVLVKLRVMTQAIKDEIDRGYLLYLWCVLIAFVCRIDNSSYTIRYPLKNLSSNMLLIYSIASAFTLFSFNSTFRIGKKPMWENTYSVLWVIWILLLEFLTGAFTIDFYHRIDAAEQSYQLWLNENKTNK